MSGLTPLQRSRAFDFDEWLKHLNTPLNTPSKEPSLKRKREDVQLRRDKEKLASEEKKVRSIACDATRNLIQSAEKVVMVSGQILLFFSSNNVSSSAVHALLGNKSERQISTEKDLWYRKELSNYLRNQRRERLLPREIAIEIRDFAREFLKDFSPSTDQEKALWQGAHSEHNTNEIPEAMMEWLFEKYLHDLTFGGRSLSHQELLVLAQAMDKEVYLAGSVECAGKQSIQGLDRALTKGRERRVILCKKNNHYAPMEVLNKDEFIQAVKTRVVLLQGVNKMTAIESLLFKKLATIDLPELSALKTEFRDMMRDDEGRSEALFTQIDRH